MLTSRLNRRLRALPAIAVAGAVLLTACGSSQPVKLAATASPTVKSTATPTPPPPTPTPAPPPIVAGASFTAPALVQIENLSDARPESGLQSANIVYEYSAEGGIGRFTAIYFAPPQGQVGPIRSARLISPVLVQFYGGTLIYSGSSVYVYHRLVADRTPRYDETSAGRDMFRIGSRFAPHNLYTDGGRVADMVHRSNQPRVSYTLWARSTSAAGGAPVSGFVAPVSPSERPQYTWHPELNGWTRTEPDTGVFTDVANGGKPVVAGTVIVMQVPARLNPQDIENGCCTAGWEYTLGGSGAAQVFTGGQEYDGSWTQPAAGGPPQFTTAAGAAAPIADGVVWICVVPTGQRAAAH